MKAVVTKIQQLGANIVWEGTILHVLTEADLIAYHPQIEKDILQYNQQRGKVVAEEFKYIWVSSPTVDNSQPFTIPLDRVMLLDDDEFRLYGVLFSESLRHDHQN